MNFLISIILTALLIFIGRKFIKKHSILCYIVTGIISLLIIIASYSGSISSFPPFIKNNIMPLFTKSTFATSIFVVVMYTGALKNGSKLMKILMPIRAELSIIASILTLAHNISFGRYHFVTLFTNPKSMSLNMILAAIISIILIAIMIPLMITSFPMIRKKMKYKSWKMLQRSAYAFYGLIYIHVMLIMLPIAKCGNLQYILNVLIYSLVFLIYATMRVNKALNKKVFNKSRTVTAYCIAVVAFACITAYALMPSLAQKNTASASNNTASASNNTNKAEISLNENADSSNDDSSNDENEIKDENSDSNNKADNEAETKDVASLNIEENLNKDNKSLTPQDNLKDNNTSSNVGNESNAGNESNINNTPPSSDNSPSTPSNPPSAPNDTPSNEPTGSTSSIYKDGVYEGTGSGYNGNITVKVTIKNDVITNLVVIDTVDNSPFVDTAISGIFDSILNSQSPDVDTVSGATFSSKGLISAVKAALKNAEN